ncbi:hypothetical protein G6F31_017030 [Rhizopus arrhizus]|nr:hypothetical protein G6F31_017030 [Rhizopus arrhizus]
MWRVSSGSVDAALADVLGRHAGTATEPRHEAPDRRVGDSARGAAGSGRTNARADARDARSARRPPAAPRRHARVAGSSWPIASAAHAAAARSRTPTPSRGSRPSGRPTSPATRRTAPCSSATHRANGGASGPATRRTAGTAPSRPEWDGSGSPTGGSYRRRSGRCAPRRARRA